MKTIGAVLVLAALVGIAVGYSYGVISTIKHYAPRLAAANSALDAIIAKTAADKLKQGEHNAQLSTENDIRIARINAYYKRLLHTQDSNSADPTTRSNHGDDGVSCESTAIKQSFELACVKDANKVVQWQTWAKRHDFPVQ